MTISEAVASASEATCREVLEYLFLKFAKPAFGSLQKKEIELLMFEGLVRIGYLDDEPSIYQLVRQLRVTRTKSRSLIYERDLRRLDNSELNVLLKAVLAEPRVHKQGDLFSLEIENLLVIDYLKERLRVLGFIADGSFSPNLVRLSADAFQALLMDCIPSENHSAVKAALIAAGAPDGSFSGVIKGILVKLGGKFADSAGEELAENISDYLGPLITGASAELTSRISLLFSDIA